VAKKKEPETGCCPRFEPKKWDGKLLTFKDKLFVKDHVTSIFHIPLNINQVMVKNFNLIHGAGAADPDNFALFDENSMWGSDIYIAVTKKIPEAKMERISGSFLLKAFEGDFSKIGCWARDMHEFVKKRGKRMKRLYFWYTTCPGCAKVYGKNYVVLVAQV
jgi:hypothetical protein